MARTKEFDPDAATQRAMDIFWCGGYEATSLQDLLSGLGIGRGSFYDTFGSKRELYLRALDRYRERNAQALMVLLDEPGPVKPALRRMLTALAEDALGDPERRGCFMVNSAIELSSSDPEVARRAVETFRRIERALAVALRRAQAEGEIAADRDPTALARFLVTTIQGLRVMGKANPDRALLEDAIDTALSILG